MRAVNWDQRKYLETAPLQVQDVLFNSILCRANEDLARIAEIVGEDPGMPREWHRLTADAINSRLWDDQAGTYWSYDRVAKQLLKDDTIAAFLTLYGGVATEDRARRLIDEHLLAPKAYWPVAGYPVPTTAIDSPWFNAENNWLGPVWVNTNWMTMHGLTRYGRSELAGTIRDTTLSLVQRFGYREYYNTLTGEGYGTDSFSWTAALTIDLLGNSESA
jgi:neutral trehalase